MPGCALSAERWSSSRKREWDAVQQARVEAEQQWQAEYRARKRLARLVGHITWFAAVFVPAAVIAQLFPGVKGSIGLAGFVGGLFYSWLRPGIIRARRRQRAERRRSGR